MSHHRPGSKADREALRAVLVEALADLRDADDPHRAAEDVMRAMDVYLDDAPARHPEPRETPVTNFAMVPTDQREARWTLWLVLACGVLATVVAAVVLNGGVLAGAVMLAIWVTVMVTLVSN